MILPILNEIWPFVAGYLPNLLDPIVVEIGCADAVDSAFMLNFMKGGKFYAFEPDPRTAARFSLKDPRVHFEQKALGSSCGKTTFHLSCDRHPFSSSIRKPKAHLQKSPDITFTETCEVELITLDSFCERMGIERIDFLWCDAQGAEGDILLGAEKTLDKIQCMVLEYSDLELYEGQALQKDLLARLEKDFEVLGRFNCQGSAVDGDVLLRRREKRREKQEEPKEFRKREVKIYLYGGGTCHVHDTIETPEYRNSVPLSLKGLEDHTELVSSPEEAEFFYMGQFTSNKHLMPKGFELERFPYLNQYPEKHIADVDGDWDFDNMMEEFPSILWKCILTSNAYDSRLPSYTCFVRPATSRLLMASLKRHDLFLFSKGRARFGFRGAFRNHWCRFLLKAYFLKWDLMGEVEDVIYIDKKGRPVSEDPEAADFEVFMLQHGLAICPRGSAENSIRFYEACFYGCVPIVIGNHGFLGDDFYDTSFAFQISHLEDEKEMKDFFLSILETPFSELHRRAVAARTYFEKVVRPYFQDPTAFFLEWMKRKRLWKG